MILPRARAVGEPREDESDPLLERVDLLLKRHRQMLRAPDDDVPVLTEVVPPQDSTPGDARGPETAVLAAESVQELVTGMRREILAHLEPRIATMFADTLGPTLAAAVEQALADARDGLTEEIRRIVHAAVDASVARALEAGQNDDSD